MGKLFLIAGHGAGDSGAIGNGYQEHERVRVLAKKIKEYGGNNVILGDISRNWYKEKLVSSYAFPSGCMILELHMDSGGAGAHGGHVIIRGTADKYDVALSNLMKSMFAGRASTIVSRTDLANPNRAHARGLNYRLVEFGFISDANDVKKFNSNIDKLAKEVLKCFGISVGSTSSTTNKTQCKDIASLTLEERIKKVGKLCTDDEQKNGILACVTLAQGILESGQFKSELGVNANNLFGMKAELSGNTWKGSVWDGTTYTKETKEWNGSKYVTISAKFRKYKCIEDSIADHSAYLLNAMNGAKKRYEGVTGRGYKNVLKAIKNGGYATSPTYVENLCKVVEDYGLTKYNYNPTLVVDGSWGKTTTRRVQEVMKVGIDGIISNQPESNKKYLTGCDSSSWEFKSSGYEKGSNTCRALQEKIKGLGYYKAVIDGIFGKKSVLALQNWLKDLGLYKGTIDGITGKVTVKALQTYLNKLGGV